MLELQAAILAAMMNPQCPRDEPAEQCAPWRAVVAASIAEASEHAACAGEWAAPACKPIWNGAPDELAAHLVEVAFHESGFRKRIQAGDCHDDECAAIRRSNGKPFHLAASMWQMHATPDIPGIEGLVSRKRWHAIVGTDPTAVTLAAFTAATVLIRDPHAFGVELHNAGGKRGATAYRILQQIRAAAKKAD